MNRLGKVLLLLLSGILLLAACKPAMVDAPALDVPLDEERMADLQSIAAEFTGLMDTGAFDQAEQMLDETMKRVFSAEKIEQSWKQLTDQYGDFTGMGASRIFRSDPYDIVEHTLVFAQTGLKQRTVFNANAEISGLFFQPGIVENEDVTDEKVNLPNNVKETSVRLESQPGYRLRGTLTLPKNPIATIVLVQGSGPLDADGTVGVNKPFRDIAYGLAAQGIAVFRYDKITYTYGSQLAASEAFATLTVDEETVLDAAAAVNWVKGEELLPNTVFLLGHSMGGSLLAYIGMYCDPDGYISMAGTPNKIWQISMEQNLMLKAEYEAQGKTQEAAQVQAIVDEEYAKAQRLQSMTDDEALSTAVFGIPAWYQRHWDAIDVPGLHMTDKKPLLVLQGGKDRQVYADKDYIAWQQLLSGHPDVTFKLYDALNHLFGEYTGEPVPVSAMVQIEYNQRTPVPQYVIDDIALWIQEQMA